MNLINQQIQEPTVIAANSELLPIDISQYPEINHMIGNNYPMIDIDLPFPPVIEPKDLIVNKKFPQDNPNGKQSRAPNAFIIYRKAFVKAARDQGYILPMTVISTMASASWEKESSFVKEEYKKIAKDTHKLIKEMFPKKSNQRKRKEKWNLVSFQNKSLNDKDNLVISTQELTTINDNDNDNNNNSMVNTPLTTVSSILTTAASSPNLSEFDGNISEKGSTFQQQSILGEVQISNDYLIDELNNTYLPNSFQEYLNSYLPGEDNQSGNDFLLKSWLNQSQDHSEFTLEEIFDTTATSMDNYNLKECYNSPTSLNMTLAEAMGIINSENFKEDLENFY